MKEMALAAFVFASFFHAFSIPASSRPPEKISSPANESDLIAIETFTAPGHIAAPRLSPDGSKMIYKEKIGKKSYITIEDVGSEDKERLEVSAKLNWYRWAGNERLLVSSGLDWSVFGMRLFRPGLYSYHIANKSLEKISERSAMLKDDNVLHVDPHGRFFLLAAQKSPRYYPSVFRVSLLTKEFVEIVEPENRINQWIADQNGIVRIGLSFRGRSMRVYYRLEDNQKFRFIGKVKANGKEEELENSLYDITKIVSGSDAGYLLSNKKTGRFALHKFNYATREIGEEVFGHPENDVTDFQLDVSGKKLVSVTYTDSRDRIVWFDEALKKHQDQLEKAVPGQEVWIQSRSNDNKKMIVFTTSSTDPGSYYLFEPAARKLHRFGGINDPLDPERLSKTKYLTYTARDGLKINAYLTLPKKGPSVDLPLIIMPHGGPFGVRDTPDFHYEVQFLANRGYAVFQPNYRGSGSYGEEFYKAGEGQIGRGMQDDLDDGMDWLVEQQIVDPARVCIYGSSYGGYAAMWGVIRNPERYRCAISFAGVTDWKKQLKFSKKLMTSRYRREYREAVRGEDDFDLDDVSPAENVGKLNRPLLIGHGGRDDIVPKSQFDHMLKRAKKTGIKLETKLYENEDHHLSNRENQKDWLARIEKFLKTHNPI